MEQVTYQQIAYIGVLNEDDTLKIGIPLYDTRRQNRINITQNKATLTAELDEIQAWFAVYDNKISEHARCARLGTTCHHNIVALDVEAMQKQERLRNIRQLLNTI